jgi:rare lipoprotein A
MLTALCAPMFAVGCHHAMQVAYQPPPPGTTSHAEKAPPGFFDDTRGKPVFTETGIASWYGPGFHHKPGADGTVFDQDAMTAAHRTLPLGSTARVTNLATGEQVLVRITDRGPFAPGRVIDLSRGAAKACGVYRTGIAKVKVEGFRHVSADPTGKWAVQTGAFKTQQDALDLKAALIARYRGARVMEFSGPTGFWVRIDPALHDRAQAEAMLDWIGKPDEQALPYLVRLD